MVITVRGQRECCCTPTSWLMPMHQEQEQGKISCGFICDPSFHTTLDDGQKRGEKEFRKKAQHDVEDPIDINVTATAITVKQLLISAFIAEKCLLGS